MDAAPLRDWLQAGYGAEMHYLARQLPLARRPAPGVAGRTCGHLCRAGLSRCARRGIVSAVRMALLCARRRLS